MSSAMKLETGGVIKMTKDEALKLALKALDIYDYTGTAEESELVSKTLNACKEALEQSEQAGADKGKILNNLKYILTDDSIAITFQSMASYRKYLIGYIDFMMKPRSE